MAIARVVLTWNDPAIERIGMDEAGKLVTDMTRATFNRANILTPVRTGRLRSANNWRVYIAGQTWRGEVYNNVSYAAAVHNGAEPRRIYAKPRPWKGGGALRFKAGGRVLFRKYVDWPGTKARPWLVTAMVQTAPRYGFVIDNLGPA